MYELRMKPHTGKSLSEALLFSEHGENPGAIELGGEHVVYKKIHNMFSPGLSLDFSCIELVIQ